MHFDEGVQLGHCDEARYFAFVETQIRMVVVPCGLDDYLVNVADYD